MVILIGLIGLIIYGANTGMALAEKNWHSAMGWGCAVLLTLALIGKV